MKKCLHPASFCDREGAALPLHLQSRRLSVRPFASVCAWAQGLGRHPGHSFKKKMLVDRAHSLPLGTTIRGFTVVESEYVSETSTQLIKLIHEQSGLTVFKHIPQDASYTENSANIAFATFASDDKGLPHITEHSVFCGSELYPHKDPFNEVTKTSLKVYNNAFTAQTHTVYEFASRCKRDYFNILSVYLDAVFRPALLKDPRIYAQEGWHLHLETEDGEIVQSGIVLNEMKSRCASPSTVLVYNLQRLLYGGTAMGYETEACQMQWLQALTRI